jgi:hypothetical protein
LGYNEAFNDIGTLKIERPRRPFRPVRLNSFYAALKFALSEVSLVNQDELDNDARQLIAAIKKALEKRK